MIETSPAAATPLVPLSFVLIGPGRAGMSLGAALVAAGHRAVGVLSRTDEGSRTAAAILGAEACLAGEQLPAADLAIIAVRDDAIAGVTLDLTARAGAVAAAVHLSGLVSVAALEPLAATAAIGSFHPLQTLPSMAVGARQLRGAWAAVTTADPPLNLLLHQLAHSIGMKSFDLEDGAKPVYHAAAAAAANFPLADLVIARDLFAAADVPFAVARPLVEAIVANAFELGPEAALTGPVARGDVATVEAQLSAVEAATPSWTAAYAAAVVRLARIVGNEEAFASLPEVER